MNPRYKNKRIPTSELLMLSAVPISIGLSLFLFFIQKKPLEAIYIGLWAPTIIGIINYLNLKFKK
jgi:hypothetical protein